jgi:hypothetical protein
MGLKSRRKKQVTRHGTYGRKHVLIANALAAQLFHEGTPQTTVPVAISIHVMNTKR